MVHVFSENDISSLLIALWLKKNKIDYKLYNEFIALEELNMKLTNSKFKFEFKIKNSKTIIKNEDLIIYRRGETGYYGTKIEHVDRYIKLETEFTNRVLFRSFDSFYTENSNNKLLNLIYAKESGLCIPDTLVTTSKKDLIDFINSHKKIILKPLSNSHIDFKQFGKRINSQGTLFKVIDDIKNIPDKFGITFIQKYIEKKLELRIQVYKSTLFVTAIFSQISSLTMLDYRKGNLSYSPRIAPYKISNILKKKILIFMKKTGLQSGSIDVILGKDNKYYFLEVNPTGIFYGNSDICNFAIEKFIAKDILNILNEPDGIYN